VVGLTGTSEVNKKKKQLINEYGKEHRNITYSLTVVEHTTGKKPHKVTQRKEDPNPTTTNKTLKKNHIIQHP
jgi:hypothetical protein